MKHFACSFCITLGIFTAATIATPIFIAVQKAVLSAMVKAEIKKVKKEFQKNMEELNNTFDGGN